MQGCTRKLGQGLLAAHGYGFGGVEDTKSSTAVCASATDADGCRTSIGGLSATPHGAEARYAAADWLPLQGGFEDQFAAFK